MLRQAFGFCQALSSSLSPSAVSSIAACAAPLMAVLQRRGVTIDSNALGISVSFPSLVRTNACLAREHSLRDTRDEPSGAGRLQNSLYTRAASTPPHAYLEDKANYLIEVANRIVSGEDRGRLRTGQPPMSTDCKDDGPRYLDHVRDHALKQHAKKDHLEVIRGTMIELESTRHLESIRGALMAGDSDSHLEGVRQTLLDFRLHGQHRERALPPVLASSHSPAAAARDAGGEWRREAEEAAMSTSTEGEQPGQHGYGVQQRFKPNRQQRRRQQRDGGGKLSRHHRGHGASWPEEDGGKQRRMRHQSHEGGPPVSKLSGRGEGQQPRRKRWIGERELSKKDKDKCAAKHRRRQERERALEREQARKKEQEEQMAAYLNPVLEDVQREANKYSEAVQGKLLGNAERKRYEASKTAALRIQAAARRKQVRNIAEGAAKQREQARKQEQEEQNAAYRISPSSSPRGSNESSANTRQAPSLEVNDGKGGGAEGEEGRTTSAELMGLTVALAEAKREVEGLTVAAVRQDRATSVKTTTATAAGQVAEVGISAAAATTTRTKKRRRRVPHHSTPHAQPTLEEIQQQLLQNATRRLPEVSPMRHTMAQKHLMNNAVDASLYNAPQCNPPSGGNPTLLGLHNPSPLIVKPRKGGHSRQGHLVQVGTAAKIPAFRPGQTGPPLPASHTAVCSICTLQYPTSGLKDHVHFHQVRKSMALYTYTRAFGYTCRSLCLSNCTLLTLSRGFPLPPLLSAARTAKSFTTCDSPTKTAPTRLAHTKGRWSGGVRRTVYRSTNRNLGGGPSRGRRGPSRCFRPSTAPLAITVASPRRTARKRAVAVGAGAAVTALAVAVTAFVVVVGAVGAAVTIASPISRHDDDGGDRAGNRTNFSTLSITRQK